METIDWLLLLIRQILLESVGPNLDGHRNNTLKKLAT
jgi:hypothetical protein